jgi:hypothetical protein
VSTQFGENKARTSPFFQPYVDFKPLPKSMAVERTWEYVKERFVSPSW